MVLHADHLVVRVNELNSAKSKFSQLGFCVIDGGKHTDNLSKNCLITFSDGWYIELIEFLKQPSSDHSLFSWFYKEEGPVDYAFYPDEDVSKTILEMGEKNVEYVGPIEGGRITPDGKKIRWKLGWPSRHDIPFLCADITPREWRVGKGSVHKNQACGLASQTVVVVNLKESTQRFETLVGVRPFMKSENEARFHLKNGVTLHLVHPTKDQEEMYNFLIDNGEGPYSVELWSQKVGQAKFHVCGLNISFLQMNQ
ncbi:uncharacterized protein VTP21DRAFT_2907 [Calcarisporiella thermophila]|uniref:uncharacterized protein n=1 Tax=Calcarisporiella thermophila TaxID=911321 RepID=UPI00374444D5